MSDSDKPVLYLRYDQKIINPDGTATVEFVNAWNNLNDRTGGQFANAILGVINGATQLSNQNAVIAAQLAAEATSRITNDAALQNGINGINGGGGGGGGTSNSGVFSAIVSSAATWVAVKSLTLTPTAGGGDYTITVSPDTVINGHLSDEGPSGATFTGNWRVIEELTAGGTEHVLDSGTFSVTYAPESEFELIYEGGSEIIVFPESWTVAFTGLPSGLIAANEGAQVDIRFEIQRASGTNEITAPGLSGAMSVVWTA